MTLATEPGSISHNFMSCVVCGHETVLVCINCSIASEGKHKPHVCSALLCQLKHNEKFHPDQPLI